jgi:hypothetical protein
MWERTGVYKVLVGKYEGKRTLGRTGWRSRDQRILLNVDLYSKWDGRHGKGRSGSGVNKWMGSCEYGTKFGVTRTGVLVSPQPDPTEKTIERLPFFVRCGGHCCHGDLVGQTTF